MNTLALRFDLPIAFMRKQRPSELGASVEDKQQYSKGYAIYNANKILGSLFSRVLGITQHVDYTPAREYKMPQHKYIYNIAEQSSLR